jgi:electron transfer flavoprotein beta subunit
MNIIVPIKQVPDIRNVRMDEETGTVIREGVEAIVNPLDLYAIETAVQLAGTCGAKTIAVSMGPAKAADALREAVSMGIDEAILLSDKCFAGSDTWATSYVLAESIKRIGSYSIIICGERAVDGDTGQVGPGIAAWLDIPVLTYLSKVSINEGRCTVRRLVEDGYESLSCDMPCVLTVVKEIAEPGLPTLRGKKLAKNLDIPTWTAEYLGINPEIVGLKGSPTRVVKIDKPKVSRECHIFTTKDANTIETVALELVNFLKKSRM